MNRKFIHTANGVKTLRVVLMAMAMLTSVTAMAGVVVKGNVYGGGNLAAVGGNVTVNMKAGTVEKDVYGGGALANTNIKQANANKRKARIIHFFSWDVF